MTASTIRVRHMTRRLVGRAALLPAAALLLAIAPERAAAQFTGVVSPPPRQVEAVAPVAADSIRSDSLLAATRLTDMKTWVDSAAGTLGVATTATPAEPGAMSSGGSGTAGHDATGREADPTFRDGAPAPDTATSLPLLALIGATTLCAGLLLRRQTPAPRPALARRSSVRR